MVRRWLIVLMVVSALGVSLVGCVSCYVFQCSVVRVSSHHWVIVQMGDGLLRMFWIASKAPRIDFSPSPNRRYVGVVLEEWGPPASRDEYTRMTPYGISFGRRNQVSPFAFLWRRTIVPRSGTPPIVQSSMLRIPAWVPVGLLLIYPLQAYVRGPLRTRRRHKRNECLQCGYSRMGLSEPRCPECGASHAEVCVVSPNESA